MVKLDHQSISGHGGLFRIRIMNDIPSTQSITDQHLFDFTLFAPSLFELLILRQIAIVKMDFCRYVLGAASAMNDLIDTRNTQRNVLR